MRAGMGLLVAVLGLAGCVSGQTGIAPGAHSCVTTVTGLDGKPQQAVIEADDAGAAAALCDGGAALPNVAGVPQKLETQDLGGGLSVKTYTYGTPPAAARAVPVQSRPAPMAGGNPLIHPRAGGPGCGLVMVGGTGYVCAPN